MPRNFCISIGVRKSGALQSLDAARADAVQFADWARSSPSNYETFLVTDEEGPVTVARIKEITTAVVAEYPARLIIYYSGHGIAGPGGDKWLLSNYDKDSGESIDVDASMRNARRVGIGQVAIFSDACRTSLPNAVYLSGSTIVGIPQKAGLAAPYDEFFSTDLAQPAQEVSGSSPHGIFTECLLKALNGFDLEATESRNGETIVSSISLANRLEYQVPYASGLIPNAVVQQPSITASWRRPNDVYVVMQSREVNKGRNGSAPMLDAEDDIARDSLRRKTEARRRAVSSTRDRLDGIKTRARGFAHQIDQAFDTDPRERVSVVGADVLAIDVSQRRLPPVNSLAMDEANSTAAFHFRDSLVIAQRFPGFKGSLILEAGLLESLNYVSVDETGQRSDAQRSLSAEWSALLTVHRTIDKARLNDFASRMRQEKHQNPALGILAGYAYERAGNLEQLASVAWFFAERNGWVPFDLMLLLSAYGNSYDLIKQHAKVGSYCVIGRFPLITRGWSIVDEGAEYPYLGPLRTGLLDAVWTTFSPAVENDIAEFVKRGTI
nr:caspase family protein [Rhizobium leguminosarum]